MKKTLLFLFFLAVSLPVWAQQDPMYTQYMFNGLVLNPAYAGSREAINITALHRTQWVGIPGAPTTTTLSAHAPVKKDNIGLGLILVNDRIGVTETNNVGFNYAYMLKMRKGILSLGLQASVMQYRADFASVIHNFSPDVFDPSFASVVNRWLPNFGTGVYYRTNKFYAGLSIPNILTNNLNGETNIAFIGSNRARQYRHAFFTSGYVFDVTKGLKLKPSFLLKYVDGAPLEIDLNANLWLYDMFAVGLSYRSFDSIDALFEFQVTPQLSLGYAYDYTLTPLGRYTSGTHEIMIRYEFGFGKSRIITPRYF
ncbi:MAG: type IX secretion system membrane protein PorP/SprF [Cytophagales bacterium]|nr:type IX secretion system membrane protein PorP/SprF [Bernardetiaceae bacterium]MDW8204967.1 type IX secretion system membrane protein PorP/SprF [Cytophagales bacterium]